MPRAVSLLFSFGKQKSRQFNPNLCQAYALDLDDTILKIPWLTTQVGSQQAAQEITKPGFTEFLTGCRYRRQPVLIVTNNKIKIVQPYLQQLLGSCFGRYVQGAICSDGFVPGLVSGSPIYTLSQSIEAEIASLEYGSKERSLRLLPKILEIDTKHIAFFDNDGAHTITARSQGYIVLSAEDAASHEIFERCRAQQIIPRIFDTRL